MDSLPHEIKQILVKHADRNDLFNLRLTSKEFSALATQVLFSHVSVRRDESTQIAFNSILASPEISRMVERVKLMTCEDPYDEDSNTGRVAYFDEGYKIILDSVNRLPNLRGVELQFSNVCSADNGFRRPYYGEFVTESVEFRFDVLKAVFSALNCATNAIPEFRSLSILNLQNYNVEELVSSDDFKAVLARITDLKLAVIMEFWDASPESSWEWPEMYTFFQQLPDVWLKPAADGLKSLTIHADQLWGYIPKCDFCSVHFPVLEKLELQNYTFSHDWQLDWLFMHGSTLQELILDACLIASYSRTPGPPESISFPINPMSNFELDHTREYPRSWAYIFGQFQKKLPNLRYFKFGSRDFWNHAMADDEEWRIAGLEGDCYLCFNYGYGPTPWMNFRDFIEEVENLEPEISSPLVDRKELNLVEDQKAYEELMAVVQARARQER